MEVAVLAEQGVMLALRKSHHQGPFTLTTIICDQQCHKGMPLRVSMVLPEECFVGHFAMCLECIVFQGFRLRAALRATLRADLRADSKGGHQGRLMGSSALLLANGASRTVINQPRVPRTRLATRTCAIPL